MTCFRMGDGQLEDRKVILLFPQLAILCELGDLKKLPSCLSVTKQLAADGYHKRITLTHATSTWQERWHSILHAMLHVLAKFEVVRTLICFRENQINSR